MPRATRPITPRQWAPGEAAARQELAERIAAAAGGIRAFLAAIDICRETVRGLAGELEGLLARATPRAGTRTTATTRTRTRAKARRQ
jgi:hypothetical protein